MQINNSEELERAIIELEKRKVIQQSLLMSQFHSTVESMKPANIIKNTLNKMIQPGDTRSTLIKAASGIAMGLLTKNFLLGHTGSKVGALLGNALKITTTNVVYKNADKLKAYGTAIYNNLFKKHRSSVS